jgi:hypothetical protein
MADSTSFDFACSELERGTSLERLEARGTVRLAHKDAGLDTRSVTALQMSAVMTQLMPKELKNRGVDNAEPICRAIASALAALPDDGFHTDTPESVFQRLGGSR